MNERIIHIESILRQERHLMTEPGIRKIQSILKQEINQMKEAEIRKLRAELNQLKGSPDNGE